MRIPHSALALIPMLSLVACEDATDTATEPWYQTEVLAETAWFRDLEIGGRSAVGVTEDGRAYFGGPDGVLHLEPAPGEQPVRYGPYQGLEHELFTPLVDDGVALLRNVRGNLLAVDLAADEVLWQTVDHMPVVVHTSNGPVAMMQRNTTDPALIGRDLHSGELLWTVEDDALSMPLHDVGEGMACGAQTDVVAAISAQGEVLWSAAHGLADPAAPSLLTCVVANEHVVVLGAVGAGPAAELVAFDASGSEVSRVAWPYTSLPTKVVARDDSVLVVWSDREMVLYDDGLMLLEQYDDRSPHAVDPVTGAMYLRTDGGHVLTDVDFNPLWTGAVDRPMNAYRYIGSTVVDDRVYWADGQDGVLGLDRWTRYVALGPGGLASGE